MDDLIRRADVLALAKDVTLKNGAKHRCIDATLVHEIQSAEPEIVRCKDCKYYNPIGVCIEMSSAVCEDSFCCWAERPDEQSD